MAESNQGRLKLDEWRAQRDAALAEAKAAQPAITSAQTSLNSAQSKLDEFSARPDKTTLGQLVAAKKEATANPANQELQNKLAATQEKWDAGQAQYKPLLAERDKASTELINANKPKTEAETKANTADLSIAKIDPTQASPEAQQYLKENGGLPVTSTQEPSLPQNQTASPEPSATTQNTVNSNTEGLPVQAEDGSLATSKRNPETGQLYNPVAGSVAEGELSAVPDPQKTLSSDANNSGEGFGTIRQNENGGFVNADGNPVDANGLLIPPIAPEKTIADVNNGGEGFGNVYPDGFGGYVNGDGQPTDANGSLIPATPQKTVSSASESQSAESGAHGAPYDDDGNLMPGWSLDEDNNPVWLGGDFVEPATAASAKASREAASPNTTSGASAAQLAPAKQAQKFEQKKDWRVRLSLAPSASYLYKVAGPGDLLEPLKATDGVIFPYSPTINTSYRANYDPTEVTHSNYKLHFYKNSSVDDVSITAEFTAQDTIEANYMLAVIHFFKSVTKMFYGQDNEPRAGTPPPLLYLSGYGAYQFDNHPLVVTQFTYNLPNDVDYIRAGSTNSWGGGSVEAYGNKSNAYVPALNRLFGSGLSKGGVKPKPAFGVNLASQDATYVPTKISLTINMTPIVTRNDISKNFSLKDYATGKLLRGSQRNGGNGGGIW
jgi:hypothetical protein